MISRANHFHFGNPLITATTDGGYSNISINSQCNNTKAPVSPDGSTFDKNDHAVKVKTMQLGSFDHFLLGHQQQQRKCINVSPKRNRHSTSTSFAAEMDQPQSTTTSGNCSIQVPLYVPTSICMSRSTATSTTAAAASIGLPSQYPGSSGHGHNRNNSLESSVLEELQDFDYFFGLPSSSSDSSNDTTATATATSTSTTTNTCTATEEYPPSRIQYHVNAADDDGDDLMHTFINSSFSRPLQLEEVVRDDTSPSTPVLSPLQRSHISELSSSSFSMPLSRSTTANSHRSSISSSHQHRSPVSTTRRHRRSRNFAMGGKEFHNAVLKEL